MSDSANPGIDEASLILTSLERASGHRAPAGGLTLQQSFEIEALCCDTLRRNFSHEVIQCDITKKLVSAENECQPILAQSIRRSVTFTGCGRETICFSRRSPPSRSGYCPVLSARGDFAGPSFMWSRMFRG